MFTSSWNNEAHQSDLAVRPFTKEDYAAVAEIDNEYRPAYLHYTAADLQRWDQENAQPRLVVGHSPLAFLEISMVIPRVAITTPMRFEGVALMKLAVTHAHLGLGFGHRLYERGIDLAEQSQAHTLQMRFYREGNDGDRASTFLQRRGFTRHEVRQTSYLNLAQFEAVRFAHFMDPAMQRQVHFFQFSALPDTTENWYKLYNLLGQINPRLKVTSFQEWITSNRSQVDWSREILLLGAIDQDWICVNNAALLNESDKNAIIPFTGVAPTYRGRGLGTAVELRLIEIAQQCGYRNLYTSSLVNNAPITTIKQKLGFIYGPQELTYSKVLNENKRWAWMLQTSKALRAASEIKN